VDDLAALLTCHLSACLPVGYCCFYCGYCRNVGATVCCPGPLATGTDGKPRVVYGPGGLITQVGREGEAGWQGAWTGSGASLRLLSSF
jgi:hypothetical protein